MRCADLGPTLGRRDSASIIACTEREYAEAMMASYFFVLSTMRAPGNCLAM